MNELALFAGAGGGILGGHLLGWKTVCAVEIEDYPKRVLLARQRDGILPRFPIWDDVTTFDGRIWNGRVDVVSGGFPCQDISCAGKGEGLGGSRSGLWAEMARIVGEVQPRFVFVENSPMLTSRGLGVVLGDLAELGYDARWGVLGGKHIRATIIRERVWILAFSNQILGRGQGGRQRSARELLQETQVDVPKIEPVDEEKTKSEFWRGGDGVAARVDRLKAIGNGQLPAVAALAWRVLSK